MAPVTEFALFAATNEYREKPEILKPAQELVSKAKGWLYTYHGVQNEDNATVYLLVGWDDLDSHRNLMRNKAAYDPLLAALQPAISPSKPLDIFYIQFHMPPIRPFSAPCTEISFFRVKKTATDRDKGRLTQLMVHLEKVVATSRSGYSCAWGPCVDREGLIAFVAGWESPEAHLELVKNNEELAAIRPQILEIAELEIKHSKLSIISALTGQ